jgi:hypothetical protein
MIWIYSKLQRIFKNKYSVNNLKLFILLQQTIKKNTTLHLENDLSISLLFSKCQVKEF